MLHVSRLAPCSHEAADTCMFLHAADAMKNGCKKLMIRTVDTDDVVLAVAIVNRIEPHELGVTFGVGRNFMFVPIHDIAASTGPRKSATLPLFHALTGCD